jgi:hypothetical protein
MEVIAPPEIYRVRFHGRDVSESLLTTSKLKVQACRKGEWKWRCTDELEVGDVVAHKGIGIVARIEKIEDPMSEPITQPGPVEPPQTVATKPSYACVLCRDTGVVWEETETDDFNVLCHLCDARQDVGAEWKLERGKTYEVTDPYGCGTVGWTLIRGRKRLQFATVITGDHTGVMSETDVQPGQAPLPGELHSYLGWSGMELLFPDGTRRMVTCVLIEDHSHEMGAAYVLDKIRQRDGQLPIR